MSPAEDAKRVTEPIIADLRRAIMAIETKSADPPAVWAVVELMGHVKHAGILTEEEKFGGKLGRVDVPYVMPDCTACKGTGRVENPPEFCRHCNGFVTHYFGAASIYRVTIVNEEAARTAALHSQPRPVQPWEMPKALRAAATDTQDGDDRPAYDQDVDDQETDRW